MDLGSILMRQHLGFQHFAFVGPGGQAIEYTKRHGGIPTVMLTTVDEVAKWGGPGATRWKPYTPDAVYTAAQAWERLRRRLGERRYDVITNNCESLLNWAIYDRSYSKQGCDLAEVGKVAAGVGLLVLVVAALDAA